MVVDASIPWPELSPPGSLFNVMLFPSSTVVSDGSAEADPDTKASLQSALAQTIKAIRTTIIKTREPANLREAMSTMYESILSSEGYLGLLKALGSGGMDCGLSNWNQSGHEDMDYGNGPPTMFLGHSGELKTHTIGIMALDKAYGVHVLVRSKEGLQRLKGSPVLPALAPSSGLFKNPKV